ncbi:DUF1294 domain-containing protein [Chryseobacterium shigense]|uniref:Uncharacterized membrane protein YsdA (DUF1294 family) n=1 Tax=Chryseobacterium shigense TaxID=297244 RepID=A0A841N9R7_9FLAO|nr:DUF1294 domain-containing protein [Chryseobacterium shigense]MBB6370338.1 uncharacterized membrane protein YsdA (DUF1294 family) [Chryseobacterium shigense]
MLDTIQIGRAAFYKAAFYIDEVSTIIQFTTFAVMMIYILLIINLLTFIIFGWDKKLSIKHKRRIPENTLLGMTFIGGTLGAILGMFIFRHKISKISFLLKFSLVVLVQTGIIYWWWNSGAIQNFI